MHAPVLVLPASERLAARVSIALVAVATAASALSFFFWTIFYRDTPATVGNLRGTALTVLVVAVPGLVLAMALAARGSLRAQLLWLACAGYIAYNAVMFLFASHFSSLFLLFAALLSLSFWALLTRFRTVDPAAIAAASRRVPVKAVSMYLLACVIAFAGLWLVEVIPATMRNEMPAVIADAGLTQNTVWVLDFAFTFPLMVIAAIWLVRRRPWGYVLGGTLTIMLTIETAGIVVDQWFGHRHDPTASLAALPILLGFTAAGAFFSWLFLSRIDAARHA